MTGAGIVLYNPDINRLKENIESVYTQVDKLAIVDNGSSNIEEILLMLESYSDIEVIWNEENNGIARALNQLLYFAHKHNIQWMLTIDQDSVCDESLIANYMKYIEFPQVAMITCLFRDRNFGIQQNAEFEGEYRYVERCITSGCFMKVDAAVETGGFDEMMFIDYVDFDMCYMLKELGYKILQSGYRGVLHELGNGIRKEFFGREVIVTNHSPARRYYYSRNVVYFIRKHKGYISRFRYYKKLYGRLGVVIVYEKNKYKKLLYGFRGIFDGYKMKVNREVNYFQEMCNQIDKRTFVEQYGENICS